MVKKRLGRPRKAPDAPPVPDHTLFDVVIPYYAYTRTIEDNAKVMRKLIPITEPLQVPIRWYRTNGITMRWVQYLLTQRNEPEIIEHFIAEATNGARFLVEQLRLDNEAKKATASPTGSELPITANNSAQPLVDPMDRMQRRAVTNAILQTLRKLWVAHCIKLGAQSC